MNNSKFTTSEYQSKRDILLFTHPFAALSVRVVGTGAPANPDGGFKILAGQALQGPATLATDRQTELLLCTGAPSGSNVIWGVTQHDIEFDEQTDVMNANCILFGFVDPQKMDETVRDIPAEVREALDGKVWFIFGDRPKAVTP